MTSTLVSLALNQAANETSVDLHFAKFMTHFEHVASLAELELPHELTHPNHIVFGIVRDVAVDHLDDAPSAVFEVVAIVDPWVTALCRVAGVDHLK